MTASMAKTEEKRLHRSDQTGVEQTKNRINPASGTRSHPQVMWQVPLLGTAGPTGLIWAQNSDKVQRKAFYLGNVGLEDLGQCSEP